MMMGGWWSCASWASFFVLGVVLGLAGLWVWLSYRFGWVMGRTAHNNGIDIRQLKKVVGRHGTWLTGQTESRGSTAWITVQS